MAVGTKNDTGGLPTDAQAGQWSWSGGADVNAGGDLTFHNPLTQKVEVHHFARKSDAVAWLQQNASNLPPGMMLNQTTDADGIPVWDVQGVMPGGAYFHNTYSSLTAAQQDLAKRFPIQQIADTQIAGSTYASAPAVNQSANAAELGVQRPTVNQSANAAEHGLLPSTMTNSGIKAGTGTSNGGLNIGGSGGGTFGGGSYAPPPNMTDQQVRDYVKSNYGYLAGFLDDPELGPILMQAARGGWDQARLMGALSNTNWWKNTNDSARQWQSLTIMDPATARAQVQQKQVEIQQQLSKMGGYLTDDELNNLATTALKLGWNSQQITNTLVNFIDPTGTGGDYGAAVATVRQAAKAFMVPVSDQWVYDQAKQLVQGYTDTQSLQAVLRSQAASRWAGNSDMTSLLQSGGTPMDYFQPHIQTIAKTLELDPNSINLDDPEWSKVLGVDNGNGTTRPMTVAETGQLARQDPRWQQTDNFVSAQSNLVKTIAAGMGANF